jgi:hypothetical protein
MVTWLATVRPGIVNSPGRANLDLAFSKELKLRWTVERANLHLHAEFFNALNHMQFANPQSLDAILPREIRRGKHALVFPR